MDLNLLTHQHDFVTADEKFVLLLAGLGAGKSFAGAVFTILESIENPESNGLITANTYRQLQNATLTTLFNVCDDLKIKFTYNQNKGWVNIEGAHWYTYSLEQYDNLRGIEVGRFWLDEARDTSKEAFEVVLGRLRDKRAKKLKGRFTTTPSGYDYLHDYFVGDKKTKDFRLIKATSYQNPHLPEGYIDTLKQSYDERVFKQEVLGEFINITQGRIYYAFTRDAHVAEVKINQNYPIYVGMDFNINPMTAVICQSYGDKIHVIDEMWLMSSNTREMGLEIGRKYGFSCQIVPDSTGKAMKTAGVGLSDHEILRQMGFAVINSANPFRVDRYNSLNNELEKSRIVIDKKCVKLINDLERVSYKEGTSLPDTSDSLLTHISDALGYFVYYVSPIMVKKNSSKLLPR
jgi:phage terminase large subunit